MRGIPTRAGRFADQRSTGSPGPARGMSRLVVNSAGPWGERGGAATLTGTQTPANGTACDRSRQSATLNMHDVLSRERWRPPPAGWRPLLPSPRIPSGHSSFSSVQFSSVPRSLALSRGLTTTPDKRPPAYGMGWDGRTPPTLVSRVVTLFTVGGAGQ